MSDKERDEAEQKKLDNYYPFGDEVDEDGDITVYCSDLKKDD